MSHINDRADQFAKKLRPQKPVDNRTSDQKMVDFHKKWDGGKMRDARRRVKEARDGNASNK